MQTVAILGATGVFGRWLTPRLVASGYSVRALVRRPEAARVAIGCGADVRVADIFDAASLRAGLEGCDVGINLATSLPGPSGRGSFDANDRVRRDGTPRWIEACRDAGVKRIVQQSIAMLSASGGDAWTDEDTTLSLTDDGVTARAFAASIAMEEAVRASDLDWVILRGGLFYGPGTGFDDDWFDRARAGRLRLPGDGGAFVSLVHIADMAAATVAAVRHWQSQQTLAVCDDQPARWRDVFSYIAQVAGAEPPQVGGREAFPSFRVSNRRAREALSWAPFYTDHRAGLIR